MSYPAPPEPDVEFEVSTTTGLAMLLSILAVAGGIGAFIGLSFIGSIYIGAWAGIVIPIAVVLVGLVVVLVAAATRENGWS